MTNDKSTCGACSTARGTKIKYGRAGVQHVIPKCQKHVQGVQHVLHMQDSLIKYADL